MDVIAIAHAATEVATEVAHEPSGLAGVASTLGLNGQLFLAQLINFGVLLFVLWRLLYRPLVAHMNARRERIEEGLANAEKASVRLREIDAERAAVLQQAENEAQARLVAADDEARRIVDEGKAKAEAWSASVRERAAIQLEQAKKEMLADVRNQAADLVVLAAEKVLREKVDATKDRALVERVLKDV